MGVKSKVTHVAGFRQGKSDYRSYVPAGRPPTSPLARGLTADELGPSGDRWTPTEHLCRAEDVVPCHRAVGHLLLEGPAHRLFILVHVGRVDVAVASADGSLDGLFRISLRHLGQREKVKTCLTQEGPRAPVACLRARQLEVTTLEVTSSQR